MAAARVVPVAVITSVLVKLALIIMMLHLWWLDAHSQCGCDTRCLGVRRSTLHKYAKVRYVGMMTNGVKEITSPSDDDKRMAEIHVLTRRREFSASMSWQAFFRLSSSALRALFSVVRSATFLANSSHSC